MFNPGFDILNGIRGIKRPHRCGARSQDLPILEDESSKPDWLTGDPWQNKYGEIDCAKFPIPAMNNLASLARFKTSCPFLGRTKQSTLRTLCTATSPRYPSLSKLTEKATRCPVMGPALSTRSKELVAGYASVAGNADVEQIHKEQGVQIPAGASIEMCPHASAARAAARRAEDLATAAKKADKAKAGGCPFHKAAAAESSKMAAAQPTPVASSKPAHPGAFDYEQFFVEELDKKHQDKSYRYFNNINRLAHKFPVAHTQEVEDEVQVWCSNDYLGMGNNPVVLETMQ